jgi:hypothetical protein
MSIAYTFDKRTGYLNGSMEGVAPPDNSTYLQPIYTVGFTPRFVDGAWLDQSRLPELSPPALKLRYTSPERVAMRAKRLTDPVLDDFFLLLDDPRLDSVDLNSKSVQDGIQYSLTVIGPQMTPVYTADIIAARLDAMLSGTPQ